MYSTNVVPGTEPQKMRIDIDLASLLIGGIAATVIALLLRERDDDVVVTQQR